MNSNLELLACTPHPVNPDGFNPASNLPYGLTIKHLASAMGEWISFLRFINAQLHTRDIARLEKVLMPATFSGMVGEFMVSAIPKLHAGLAKNRYHNGHPDLVPAGRFPNDEAQHGDAGIEVKGSRYARSWQGHNPEATWLMGFVFDANRLSDADKGIAPRRFRFVEVVAAPLSMSDWSFSGRSPTSRRTITASVIDSGIQKKRANWIYRDREPTPARPPRRRRAKANRAVNSEP